MASKHTDGPWFAERAVDHDGFETGKLWIVMKGQPMAYDFDRFEDANLAAAAPELLEALTLIRDEGMKNHNTRCREWWPTVPAAIARATGAA